MIQFSNCNIFHMFLQNVLSIEENSPMRIKRGCPIHCHPWPAWPARPHLHRHCNPPIWNLELMLRQTSGLTSRLSVLKVEIIETSGCHRTVQRPFLAPPNGSERFRSLFWGFACNSCTIPLAVCGAVRPVPVPLGICRGGTRFQLSDFWLTLGFCLTLPKKWGYYQATLWNSPFAFWTSTCDIPSTAPLFSKA